MLNLVIWLSEIGQSVSRVVMLVSYYGVETGHFVPRWLAGGLVIFCIRSRRRRYGFACPAE